LELPRPNVAARFGLLCLFGRIIHVAKLHNKCWIDELIMCRVGLMKTTYAKLLVDSGDKILSVSPQG